MYEIHIILSLSSFNSDSWVLDIAYGSHICKLLQGLQNIRVLKKGDFELYGAGGESIQVETVETYMLKLPSEKILELETVILCLRSLEILFLYRYYCNEVMK